MRRKIGAAMAVVLSAAMLAGCTQTENNQGTDPAQTKPGVTEQSETEQPDHGNGTEEESGKETEAIREKEEIRKDPSRKGTFACKTHDGTPVRKR